MAIFTIKPEDHLKGKVVEPSIYPVEISKIENKKASTGVLGKLIHLKVLEGKHKGVVIYHAFWENGMGFAIPFCEALGKKLDPNKEEEINFDATLHHKLRIAVKNEIFEGTPRNRVEGFLPWQE